MTLAWDPEFAKAASSLIEKLGAAPANKLHDIEARRLGIDQLFGELTKNALDIPEVDVTEFTVTSRDSKTIRVFRYQKSSPTAPGPAILYVHGGGMIAGNVIEMYGTTLKGLVRDTGVPIFAPEYRLAPENPHPGPVEDVYSTLTWLHENANEFGIDTARIAIQGDSAGGGISAGVALMSRDRGLSPPLAKQILMYPMIDDSNVGRQDDRLRKFLLLWNEIDNRTAWTALLGDTFGTDAVSPYAAPIRARDLSELPSTYIDMGGLDMFRDEGIAYVQKLLKVNVQVECHVFAGVPHAWEILAPEITVSQQAFSSRKRAMMSF
jgi:acetyl esterase/lipase